MYRAILKQISISISNNTAGETAPASIPRPSSFVHVNSLSQFSAVYILTSTPGPQPPSVQCSIYISTPSPHPCRHILCQFSPVCTCIQLLIWMPSSHHVFTSSCWKCPWRFKSKFPTETRRNKQPRSREGSKVFFQPYVSPRPSPCMCVSGRRRRKTFVWAATRR